MRFIIRRRRLRLAMNAAQYRQQAFRRIMAVFIAFCGITLAALVSCSSHFQEQRRPESPLGPDEPYPVGMSMETWLRKQGIEVRPATPKAVNRDSRGLYITPPCPLCGAEAALVCTTWRCINGHRYESADDEIDRPKKP